MTERASIRLAPKKRGPPSTRLIPYRPFDGYHVTDGVYEPVGTDLSTLDRRTEIEQSLRRIEELDIDMIAIDGRIDHYQELIDDPNADGWDRIDAEAKVAPLLEQRERLRGELIQHAGHIAMCGQYLIEGWKENELDNIGKELIQVDGVLDRMRVEYPSLLNLPAWKRLYAAGVPF